jgi:nucleotide-binding universal stress UspA family protein
MIEIKRILCPTDFSDNARHALDHAVTLAGWYGAEIMVLHLMPATLPTGAYVQYPGRLAHEVADRARSAEEAHRFAESARTAGVRVKVEVEQGGVVQHIVGYAELLPADLIVMGTHGRSGFERFMLGSVTEKVLREARCPVLTVPPPAAGAAGRPFFKTILCAIDFSPAARTGMQQAVSLAREADARLILLHVVEWLPEEPFDRTPTWQVELEVVKPKAEARLRAAVSEADREACRVEELVVTGRPWREILRVATEQAAELIVLGIQGRGAIDLALFGSTANHVVRHAGCAVLTVRSA